MYNHITDQFAPNLSPLARRMYAAIFEIVCNPTGAPSVDRWPVDEDGERALIEIFLCGLIDPIRAGNVTRYRLTSAAWRAHLLHERAEREKERTDRWPGIDACCCNKCHTQLDSPTTGAVVVTNGHNYLAVCHACAKALDEYGYVAVQARYVVALDDALNGRR